MLTQCTLTYNPSPCRYINMACSPVVTFKLLLLLLVCSGIDCEVYYITPISNTPCPVQTCLTLSQFAAHTTSYLSSNTTLIFLPGNHSLNFKCPISNVSNVVLTSTLPLSAVITCEHHNNSARFVFDAVSTINISGLIFIGCGGNKIRSTLELLVESCVFIGQEKSKTALELVGTKAIVAKSSFSFNTLGSLKSTFVEDYFSGYICWRSGWCKSE